MNTVNKKDIPLDIEDNVSLKCVLGIQKQNLVMVPIPKKSYKKLATELMDWLVKYDKDVIELWNKNGDNFLKVLNNILKIDKSAFNFITKKRHRGISKVYLKPKPDGNIYYTLKKF